MALFFWVAVKKKKDIQRLMNLLSSTKETSLASSAPSNFLFRCKIFLILLFVLNLLLALVTIIFIYEAGRPIESPQTVFLESILDGTDRFFYSIPQHYFNSTMLDSVSLSEFDSMSIFLGVLEVWMRFCQHMIWTLLECFYVGPLLIVLRILAEEFKVLIRETSNCASSFSTQNKLIGKYEDIKRISVAVNDVWAFPFFMWVIGNALGLIMQLNAMMESKDAINMLSLFVQVFTAASAYIHSGETYRIVSLYIH